MTPSETPKTPQVVENAAVYIAEPVDAGLAPLGDAGLAAGLAVFRPAAAVTKVAITVQFDPDIVGAFKAGGDGWQTRMNDALRARAVEHGMRRAVPGLQSI